MRPDQPDEAQGSNVPQGLARYSAKFAAILRLIHSCQGIVFIYSEYVRDGVDILAMALEQNGYRHFHYDQVWSKGSEGKGRWKGKAIIDTLHPKHQEGIPHEMYYEKQARFIVLKGDVSSSDMSKYIAEARGERGGTNAHGEKIKVIIGSKKVREGFSLHCVRQIHILDPWYHLNAIDQSIGRGIRNHSHVMLPAEERNVTTFLHTCSVPRIQTEANWDDQLALLSGNGDPAIDILPHPRPVMPESLPCSLLESSDEYIYRDAVCKTRHIAEVERVLQKHAVDCLLNKEGNMFPRKEMEERGIQLPLLVASQGKEIDNFPIGDRDSTWKCKFNTCAYTCTPVRKGVRNPVTPPISLLSIHEDNIVRIKQYVKQLFQRKFVYSIDELLRLNREVSVTVPSSVFLQAIHEIVHHREIVYDAYLREGYIIYRRGNNHRDGFYIYQPHFEMSSHHSSSQRMMADEQMDPIMRSTVPPYIQLETEISTQLIERPPVILQEPLDILRTEFINMTLLTYSSFEGGGLELYPIPETPAFSPPYEFSPDHPPIPKLYDLILMGSFIIFDRKWDHQMELEFICKICKLARKRIKYVLQGQQSPRVGDWTDYMEVLNDYRLSEEWKGLSSTLHLSKYKPIEYIHASPQGVATKARRTLLTHTPSLELCAFYWYFGGLPEEISARGEERPLRSSTQRIYFESNPEVDEGRWLPSVYRCISPGKEQTEVFHRIHYGPSDENVPDITPMDFSSQYQRKKIDLRYIKASMEKSALKTELAKNKKEHDSILERIQWRSHYILHKPWDAKSGECDIHQRRKMPGVDLNKWHLGFLTSALQNLYIVHRITLNHRSPGTRIGQQIKQNSLTVLLDFKNITSEPSAITSYSSVKAHMVQYEVLIYFHFRQFVQYGPPGTLPIWLLYREESLLSNAGFRPRTPG